MTEREIRLDERSRIIKLIDGLSFDPTSAYSGYTEKQDILDKAKRQIKSEIARMETPR